MISNKKKISAKLISSNEKKKKIAEKIVENIA
jgi:hypothetical protein